MYKQEIYYTLTFMLEFTINQQHLYLGEIDFFSFNIRIGHGADRSVFICGLSETNASWEITGISAGAYKLGVAMLKIVYTRSL